MADRSENPGDIARMTRLEGSLDGLVSELEAQRRQGEALTREVKADAARAKADRTAAAKESQTRRSTVGPGGATQIADETTVANVRAQANAVSQLRTAEGQLTAATEARNAAYQRSLRGYEAGRNVVARANETAKEDYLLRAGLGTPVTQAPSSVGGAAEAVRQVTLAAEQAKAAFIEAEAAKARFLAGGGGIGGRPQTALPPANDPRLLTQYAQSLNASRGPQIYGTGGAGTGGRRLFTTPTGGLPTVSAFAGPRTPGDLKAVMAELDGLSEREQKLIAQGLQGASSQRLFAGAMSEQARSLGLADNAYTRHGYLTSEFISAAARGQVTFRELGNQVGGTIAKFGGWTAAATAVYGALAAVSALGRGALQSASGVGLLSRVTTQQLPGGSDALQKRFRDLSRKFNLPVEDVVQASYGSAKAFSGDLPNALKATEQALFAVKVGELSAADSTLYLNAIVKGFRLTADELPPVFDAINQAQNRFGGSTGDLIAGVAKAGGIFRLAGGDYRSLIALLTTGSRLTGASAKEVSTAIARSASRVLTPQGQAALQAQGLDPNQGYLQILAQAQRKAQGATPTQVNALARALVPQGGQFARILAPILQNRALYDKIFAAISPANAKNSAINELGKALSQPNEQLKRILINLEALGSALATAGALNGLVILTGGINAALGATIHLLDAFERLTQVLPAHILGVPFRGAIAPALELLAIIKLMKFLDVGSSLPVGRDGSGYSRLRQGLQRSPGAALNSQILLGTNDEKKFLEEENRRARLTATRAAQRLESSEVRRNVAADAYINAPAGKAAQRAEALAAAEAEFVANTEAAEVAIRDANDVQGAIVKLQGQIATYERAKAAGLAEEAAALKAGILFRPGTNARPSASSPVPIGAGATAGEKGASYLGRAGGPTGSTGDVAAAVKGEEYIGREAGAVAAEQGRLAAAMASLGVTGRVVAGVSVAGAGAARTAFGGLAAARAGIFKMVASLGLLDYILIGALGIPLLTDAAKKVRDGTKKAADAIANIQGGAKGVRENAKKLGDHGGFFAQVGQEFSDAIHHPLGFAFGGGKDPLGIPRPALPFVTSPQEARDAAARSQIEQANVLAKTLESNQPNGKLLDIGSIRSKLSDKLTKTRLGASRIAAYDDALQQLQDDYIANERRLFGTSPGKGDKRTQAAAIADLKRRRALELQHQAELSGDPSQLDLAGLGDYQSGTTARISTQGLTKSNLGRLRGTTNALIQLSKFAVDDKSIEQVAQLIAGQHDQAQKIVDDYVAAHPGLDQAVAQRRGLRIAESALNLGGLKARAKSAKDDVKRLSDSIDAQKKAIEQIAGEARTIGAARDTSGPAPLLNAAGAQARLKGDRAKLKQATTLMRFLERAINGLFSGLAGAQQQLQDAQQHYDAVTQYLAAKAGGGLAGDQVTFQRGQGGPYAKLKKGSTDWFTHQADQINTQNSITDQQKQAAQDAAQKQQEAADKAKQAAEQARQNAKDLVTAQADYATSLTSDPVKQARIAYREAQRLQRYASGPAENLEAKADVNNRRRDLLRAGQQSKFDDIEFYASIGKLNKDAEIAQLQGLLKRIKDNKDLRRQIREKIYQLKHDAQSDTGLDINVGDLRLPTIYDVRRLRRQGLAAATTIQQTNSYSFSVRNDSDIERLGGELGTIHDASVRAAMRSAGLRG